MTTEKKNEGNGLAVGLALLLGIVGLIGFCVECGGRSAECGIDQARDTVREVVWDTIPYYYPVPKDSAVVRYITEKLPVASGEEVNFPTKSQLDGGTGTEDCDSVKDSANVVIPITQKHYEDSTYSAWVSGYKPSLDSLKVYPRTEVRTITIHVKERRRWNFGVSGGIGVVYDGGWHCGPCANMGVSFSF